MKLNPRDLRVDIYSIAVPGNQSAFRATHMPTGQSVSCDCERQLLDSVRRKCVMDKLITLLNADGGQYERPE